MGALMAGVVAGKTAIVTGAGRGIGRGIAMLLAKEGARVVVCDIGASLQGEGSDTGPAQETVNAIKKAGGEAIASTLSITEPKNAEAIVKMALEAFGRIDILVNNAGILRDVIFHKMSWSDWSDVIAVHLNGSFNMSRAVAPLFREQNSGAFVAHDVDLRSCRQFRAGELHGREARHHGPLARYRARHGPVQRAVELHCAVCLHAHDRVDPRSIGTGQASHRSVSAHDAGKDRARLRCSFAPMRPAVSPGRFFRFATTRSTCSTSRGR